MPTVRIPLVYHLENRTTSLDKDAKMVNSYAEIGPKESPKAIKRPGVELQQAFVAGTAQGIVLFNNAQIICVNNRFYDTPSHYISLGTSGDIIDFA